MIPMDVVGVRVELPSNTPIVLLRSTDESTGPLMLPIFIGGPEATAIAMAQEGVEPPRPMTHDLFAEMIESMSVRIERVVITELREKTFFAELHTRGPQDVKVISARPSDAIALAVRLDVPVFAESGVLDEAGFVDDGDDEEIESEAEDVVEEFRDFINDVNPEDFA